MKFLIISTTDIQKAAHSRPHQIVEYLSARQHEVTIISMNAWWLTDKKKKNFYHYDYGKNVKIQYLSEKRYGPAIQEIAGIIKLTVFNDFYDKYDVCIICDSLFFGYYYAKKMRKLGITLIFDIDDDLPKMIRSSMTISFPVNIIGSFFAEMFLKKMTKLCDKVTFTLKILQKKYHLPDNKAIELPNGVNTSLFEKKTDTQLRTMISPHDEFIVGYVGVLREWVDFEPVYIAIKNVKINVKLIIIGEEGNILQNKELVKKYGIEDKVLFTGTIPYEQVPAYISCMDIGIIPFKINSVTENALPLKLFEYMCCEKPVIAPPLHGIFDTVGDLVLYARNAEEWENCILKLYYDTVLRKDLEKRGKQFVEENYSWDTILGGFEKSIIELQSKR